MDETSPHFKSFVMAGFECTYALATNHKRLDLLSATQHDKRVLEDYQLLSTAGIHTVREGFSWHQIDKGNTEYDFDRYIPMLEAAQQEAIQQIWDLNHFDYPSDVDPLTDIFIERFAAYGQAVVKLLRQYFHDTLYIVPINEISFFAWIGADKGWWAPYLKGRANGFRLKCQLVKASIAVMKSIWDIDSNVRFIQVDPFMRRLAKSPVGRSAKKHVDEFNEVVRFEAWDMLCGKKHPELGGQPKYLDIIGVNYYIHNQEWVISPKGQGKRPIHQLMDWESEDRVSFAQMLNDIFKRYNRPLLITETGSYGEHRDRWWKRVLEQIDEAIGMGLPISGVCAYPILDRPESAGFLLPNSGIWDFAIDDDSLTRLPKKRLIQLLKSFNGSHS